MYILDEADGIPILTDDQGDPNVIRKATKKETEIFNDFWGMYWDRVEAGEKDGDELDEDVRSITLTKHGLSDMI